MVGIDPLCSINQKLKKQSTIYIDEQTMKQQVHKKDLATNHFLQLLQNPL